MESSIVDNLSKVKDMDKAAYTSQMAITCAVFGKMDNLKELSQFIRMVSQERYNMSMVLMCVLLMVMI